MNKFKPLSTTDIQTVSLEILQAVHSFCVQNSIRYSLAYGTLIGAVRHKGFIPWDDDIDIIMPRPDYDRFCHSFNAEKYLLVSEYDPKCYINYGKVFETKKTACRTLAPFNSYHTGGVSIDIFPADAVPDHRDQFITEVKQLYPHWRRQIRYRHSMASLGDIIRTFSNKDIVILLLIKFSLQGKRLLKKENRIIRDTITQRNWESTNHWSQLSFLDDGYKCFLPIEDFSDTIDVEFEGQQFSALKGWDSFLKNLYGNYMELPPVDERTPKHKQTIYYWK